RRLGPSYDRIRPEALPAREHQLRSVRGAAAPGEEGGQAGGVGGSGARGAGGLGRAARGGDRPGEARRSACFMRPLIQRWLEHLDGERALSPHTLRAYEGDLVGFLDFLGRDFLAKPIASIAPGEVDALAVRSFLASLTKRGLSRRSQGRALAAVRGFFRWAAREGIVPANPAQGIRTPKAPKTLPRHLRPGEIESLLEAPDATEPMGRRDRALL